MFKRWTRVIRALAQADEARNARGSRPGTADAPAGDRGGSAHERDATYAARLEELHLAMMSFDKGDNLARIAAWIARNDKRGS